MQPYLSAVSSNAQSNPPVLILQSLGGVQFPMRKFVNEIKNAKKNNCVLFFSVALPYSTTTTTTFPSTVPKQVWMNRFPFTADEVE